MIHIRQIQESDIESFHAALDAVCREKRYLASFEAPPIESTRAFVLENIRDNQIQMVAHDGERVVGWCDILRLTHRPIFPHVGQLGMGVISERRGQQIGKMLLIEALTRASEAGLTRIELEVFASNERAQELYKKYGFQYEGKKIKSAKFPDRYEDNCLMALILEEENSTSSPS